MVLNGEQDAISAPPKLALLAEWPRGAWNLAEIPLSWPRLVAAPRGDGRPVLLLPGLFNSDRSNFVLRRYLDWLGYRAFAWELGRNLGQRSIGAEGERLFERIEAVRGAGGGKVTLIGVSLGGVMSRLAAHRRPDLVREVITVSAPFAGPPTATNVWRAFEWLTGQKITDPQVEAMRREIAAPLPVPATAIWSASDGLVNGAICHDAACRSIEVRSSHVGVQLKPEVMLAIAQVLGGERA